MNRNEANESRNNNLNRRQFGSKKASNQKPNDLNIKDILPYDKLDTGLAHTNLKKSKTTKNPFQ